MIETEQKSWLAEATKNYSEWNSEIIEILCVRNNALAVLYRKSGYISWHNNANASAYNFIFTWSETGEGCFKYVDGMTGETVIVQDKPGGNVKQDILVHMVNQWKIWYIIVRQLTVGE